MITLEERFKRVELGKNLAADVVTHLVDDLSQYDPLYKKYSQKRVGRFALVNAREAGGTMMALNNDAISLHDQQPMLFPDIERAESLQASTDFARQVGRVYIGWLFNDTLRKNRPFSKEIFPYHDGQPRVASIYIDTVLAPQYAEELVAAKELGLTADMSMEDIAR